MKSSKSIHYPVFIGSLSIIIFVTCLSSIFPKYLNDVFKSLLSWLSINTGWVYVLSVGVIWEFYNQMRQVGMIYKLLFIITMANLQSLR